MGASAVSQSFEVVRLDPAQVHFERHGDTLTLTLADGRHYPRIVVRSCFPVSDGNVYLSVRDASLEEQPEIGIIEDWRGLSEEDRQAVADELGLYYFVPRIQRVRKVREELGFIYWTVETDKGPKEFAMHNSITHYAREIAPGRWLLIDLHQARYEIPDLTALDRHSQRLVRTILCL
jgi:hypothetical protein